MAEAATQALAQGRDAAGSRHPEEGRLGALLREYLGDRAFRQLALIVGLAAAIAAGLALFMWAQEPVYRSLYANLPSEDASAVMDALQAANIQYQTDPNTGAIMVPADSVHKARLTLASQGLPNTGGVGFESLRQDQGFGTSKFMETARFQRALETELGRTITSLRAVKTARVHLAIPEHSVFIRDRREPRASVTVGLYAGRTLTDGQVNAIVNMVASAVPELATERVTLVDQQGDLLSGASKGGDTGGASGEQLKFKHRVEDGYVRRIEDLLAPMVGANHVRAKVNARIDFSTSERTEELYDPDRTAVRSQQSTEERTDRRDGAQGVPGALSNQPPGAGTTAQTGNANQNATGKQQDAKTTTIDSSVSETKNFEVSRTVRHIRGKAGAVDRLSVAVLLDEPTSTDADGNVVPKPRTPQELEEIRSLIKQAVGFVEARGDTVTITSAPFQAKPEAEPLDTPLWEQPWVFEGGKLLLAGLLGLVLILAVVRPLINGLLGRDRPARNTASSGGAAYAAAEGPDGEPRQLPGPEHEALMHQHAQQQLPGTSGYEQKLQAAREVASGDPALAANVVKGWLSQDE
ncbi:MAG: flagellar basal-body MS-ring/collar protein FliF [Ectothiorhodospiraceae bacterium]|jgi:flagellar M-ring protein FliF